MVLGGAVGTAAGCVDTHYSVGGSDDSPGTPVYENRYTYAADGGEYSGRSYGTGMCIPSSLTHTAWP